MPPRTLARRDRLEPTSPATPSTSPACNWKLTGSASGRSSRPRASSTTRSAGAFPRRPLTDVAPHHEADELVGGEPLDLAGRDDPPVLEHRRAVGKPEDLRQPVRDVQDAKATCLELLDDVEHALELRPGEDRRRLVEDQDARFEGERTGDLDELTLCDAEAGDLTTERDRHPDAVECLSGLPPHRPSPEHPWRTPQLTAEEHVLDHGQVRDEARLLVDRTDPERAGLLRRQGARGLAEDRDRAGVGRLRTP